MRFVLDLELPTWRRIRQYAVPVAMIEECASSRRAGDWRAACAAARVDVTFTDAQASPFEAELRALAPDLLRWHLPRALGGRTSLATHQSWILSLAEHLDEDEPVLVVRLPKTVAGSQRLTLEIGKVQRIHFDLPPHFWSVSHVDGLREAYSGLGPHPADGLIEAWRAGGIQLVGKGIGPLVDAPVHPRAVAAEVRRLAARYGTNEFGMYLGYQRMMLLELDAGGAVRGTMTDDLMKVFERRRIGDAVSRRPADVDLLEHGLLPPAELHPLVRAVLRPSAPSGLSILEYPAGLAKVRCGGQWHEVEHRDGRLVLNSHDDDEIRRELAMGGLGGAMAGCVAVKRAWEGGDGRLPKALRLHRQHLFQRILHGDEASVLRMLDDGLDPRVCDDRGRTLLHHLRCVDHGTLLPRLLDAGLPIDARDRRRRTPLHVAVGDGGTPELVLALLKAGADPQAEDDEGQSVVVTAKRKARLSSSPAVTEILRIVS